MKYEKFQSIQSPCQHNIITKQITAQDKNIAVDFLCLIFRFFFFNTKSDLKRLTGYKNTLQMYAAVVMVAAVRAHLFELFTAQGNNEAIFRLVWWL